MSQPSIYVYIYIYIYIHIYIGGILFDSSSGLEREVGGKCHLELNRFETDSKQVPWGKGEKVIIISIVIIVIIVSSITIVSYDYW